MTTGEQITALSNDLQKVIDHYRHEYDIPIAGYVGVLELLKVDCYQDFQNQLAEKEDDMEDDE